jgi:uncharacterized protein
MLPPAPFDPVSDDGPDDPAFPSGLTAVTFHSHGARLVGRFFVAAGPGPHPVALLLHGFPGSEPNADLGHALRRAGWNVFFFHYRGSWGSEGAFAISRALEDVSSALDYALSPEVRDRFRSAAGGAVLVGHSMGGFLALHAAASDPRVRAAVSIGAFDFGAFGERLAADEAARAATTQAWESNCAPLRGTSAPEVVEEVVSRRGELRLCGLAPRLCAVPLLLAYSERDQVSTAALHHHPVAAALRSAGALQLTVRAFDCDHMFAQVRLRLAREVLGWLAALD